MLACYIIEQKIGETNMAKWHYVITSKDRIKRTQNSNGTENISIANVLDVKENNKYISKEFDFNKGKKDIIFNILLFVSIMALLILFLIIIIGKDIFGLSSQKIYSFSSDLTACSSLLLLIISFTTIKLKLLRHWLVFDTVGNHLIISLFILLLPFFMATLLYVCDLNNQFANLISLFCIIISLIMYH